MSDDPALVVNWATWKTLVAENGPVAALLEKMVLKVEREAKSLCPVDTGRLRSSITSQVYTEEDTIVGVVGTDVEYAAFVEFGTSRASAQPFLVPAAVSVVGDAGFSVGGAP